MLITIKPELTSILEKLDEAGGRPMIVGGAVRDALLGDHNPKDIDIEVYGITYDTVVEALRDICRTDVVGQAFQVVTARIGGESFDISLPRRDSKIGSGHRGFTVEVDHTMTFEEASSRRDFTINAIGWDPLTDEILDPYDGARHLRQKRLVDINDQFGEDPLRVLRGMQFAARFGMVMDPDTIGLCSTLFQEYDMLSVERIWGEWEKFFLKAQYPSMGLDVLRQTGWIKHYPELDALPGIRQDSRWHPEGDVWDHTNEAMDMVAFNKPDDRLIVMLAVLCHDFGKVTHTQFHEDGRITSYGHAEAGVEPAESFMRRIGAPLHVIANVLPLVREHMCIINKPTAKLARKLARRLHPATTQQFIAVGEADHLGRGEAANVMCVIPWLTAFEEAEVTPETLKPILKGEWIIEAGLTPGPMFRPIIKASIEAQDDGEITDEESARVWLQKYMDTIPRSTMDVF